MIDINFKINKSKQFNTAFDVNQLIISIIKQLLELNDHTHQITKLSTQKKTNQFTIGLLVVSYIAQFNLVNTQNGTKHLSA